MVSKCDGSALVDNLWLNATIATPVYAIRENFQALIPSNPAERAIMALDRDRGKPRASAPSVVACRNILLRLCHCLLNRPPRPEPITAFGKRPITSALQNLHHRLLNEPIQHRRDTKLSHPFSVRLGDFHPPHRLRCISSAQQLFPDGWPMLFQVVAEFIDGHAIDSRTTLLRPPPPQCFLQIVSLTYFLHQSTRIGWAFGVMGRQKRFSLFPPRFAGFTRWRGKIGRAHV